jgi:hypothetical protein
VCNHTPLPQRDSKYSKTSLATTQHKSSPTMNTQPASLTALGILMKIAVIAQATSSRIPSTTATSIQSTAALPSPSAIAHDCPFDQLYEFNIAMLPFHSQERHDYVSGRVVGGMNIMPRHFEFLNLPTKCKD